MFGVWPIEMSGTTRPTTSPIGSCLFPTNNAVVPCSHNGRPHPPIAPYFYSDRRHMWDASQKVWQAPPPSYECIMTGWDGTTKDIHGNRSNLSQYIDMSKRANDDDDDDDDDVAGTETVTGNLGTVLTLDEFKSKFE
eukprot:scaffold66710_cov47-Attheya_sp.AAC.4